MSKVHSIADTYQVATDAADWPESLPVAERGVLQGLVLEVLSECHALHTYDLVQRVVWKADKRNDVQAFNKAALLDWIYACVVRAARAADCEQRWHAPEKKTFSLSRERTEAWRKAEPDSPHEARHSYHGPADVSACVGDRDRNAPR